jgi:hypothetical protein
MSADLLRRAAKVLRERAEAVGARPESWEVYTLPAGPACSYVAHSGDPQMAGVADVMWPDAGEYIALMHPPVALAMASWLNEMAERGDAYVERYGARYGPQDATTSGWSHAISVASAVLREAP